MYLQCLQIYFLGFQAQIHTHTGIRRFTSLKLGIMRGWDLERPSNGYLTVRKACVVAIQNQQEPTQEERGGKHQNTQVGQPSAELQREHFISAVRNPGDTHQDVIYISECSPYTQGRPSSSEHACPPFDPSLTPPVTSYTLPSIPKTNLERKYRSTSKQNQFLFA